MERRAVASRVIIPIALWGHSIWSLNSVEVVDMAREKQGPIELANIFELVAMVVTVMGLAIAKDLSAQDVVLSLIWLILVS